MDERFVHGNSKSRKGAKVTKVVKVTKVTEVAVIDSYLCLTKITRY